MSANLARVAIVIGSCFLAAGCGQPDDGTTLSGTSLTGASSWGGPEDDESDSGTCPEGSAGCACYGNGTCDVGLECSQDLCVPPGGDGDGDEGDGDGDGGDGDGDEGDGDGDEGDGDGDPGDGDGDGGDGDGDGDVYYSAVGPQTDVPVADVVGWEVCYMAPYSDLTPVNTLLSNCDGDHLMLACKQANANTYTVLAHAPRADVLMEQDEPYTAHVANGSGWYYDFVADPNDYGGFGFAQAGDALETNPCDLAEDPNSDRRLCWHISASAMGAGFRCGETLWLFEGNEWQRVMLQRND